MGTYLNDKEKEQILSTLTYATHKMINELEQNRMVGNLDFYHVCEDHFEGGPWLGFFIKLDYYHDDYTGFCVKIICKYLGVKFKVFVSMLRIDEKNTSKKWKISHLRCF